MDEWKSDFHQYCALLADFALAAALGSKKAPQIAGDVLLFPGGSTVRSMAAEIDEKVPYYPVYERWEVTRHYGFLGAARALGALHGEALLLTAGVDVTPDNLQRMEDAAAEAVSEARRELEGE